MNHLRLVTPLWLLVGVVALSACDAGPSNGQAQADAATQTACRQRAEQAYEQQNRGQIYSPQSEVNTPYSGSYAGGTFGLSDVFAHDRMVNDCVRNTGTGVQRTPPTPLTTY
jgi:hypothetical protein